MVYAKSILKFFRSLRLELSDLQSVQVLNPYQDRTIFGYCECFYEKYYNDSRPRILLVGINPGRFGGGLTGIPFTDPIKLQKVCGIENNLHKKAELSSSFIYKVIDAYGGTDVFFSQFYLSSVCPLGFTYQGKNINYYDKKGLQERMYPLIVRSFKEQITFGLDTRVAFCLGQGKNFKFLVSLNQRFNFFKKILPLPHPRYIMQYRSSQLEDYVQEYVSKLSRFH